MTGLAIMLAWGMASALRRLPRFKTAAAVLASAVVVWWAGLTANQIQYWKNSETLYRHTLDVTAGNYWVHYLLGVYLAGIPGRLPEAMDHFRAATRIQPAYADAHYNLGVALLLSAGPLPEAIAEFNAALRTDPDYAEAHNNLGAALLRTPGRLADAIAQFEAALRIRPDYADAHANLALALERQAASAAGR